MGGVDFTGIYLLCSFNFSANGRRTDAKVEHCSIKSFCLVWAPLPYKCSFHGFYDERGIFPKELQGSSLDNQKSIITKTD